MKKENIEALQWFVDFANLDLITIKPGDRAKLLVEAKERLWPVIEMKEFQRGLALSLDIESSPMAWALDIPPEKSQKYWIAILQSQEEILKVFREYVLSVTNYGVVISGRNEMTWWAGRGNKSPYTMKFLPLTESQGEYLRLKIFMLLDGFQDHAIRLCPGCEKFFFNPTNREKRFCGTRCMWRISTAERRQADREGYNEYQKGLMQDRYREKKGLPRKTTHSKKAEE